MTSSGITVAVSIVLLFANMFCLMVCEDLKIGIYAKLRIHAAASLAILVSPFFFMVLTWVYSFAAWGMVE